MGPVTYQLRAHTPDNGVINGKLLPYAEEEIRTLLETFTGPGELGHLIIPTDTGWVYLSSWIVQRSIISVEYQMQEVV